MKNLLSVLLLFALLLFSGCAEKEAQTDREILDQMMISQDVKNDEVKQEENKNVESDTFSDTEVEAIPEKEEGEKTISEDFSTLADKISASYENENFAMILTFYFKDGKAVNGHVESTYKDIAQARSVYESYVKNMEYYANVSRIESTITYSHTEEGFASYKDKSMEEIKAMLEKSGFEIIS